MFIEIVNTLSTYAIIFIIFIILVVGLIKKVKVYEVFTDGAKEGFTTAIKIIPFLVGMLVAIGVFRASGAMDLVTKLISPISNLIGMPAETVPMALMRSLSGGGAQGMMVELFKQYGPDSFIGRLSSVLMGSTETTLYVAVVYFGAIGVTNPRHMITVGLLTDLASIFISVLICHLIFL